jgi:hypothetical protein
MFKRTTTTLPKHKAEPATPEVQVWVSKHVHARPEIDYTGWVTETYTVPEARIYEARAIVKDEGGIITRSASNRPGEVVLTVLLPPKGL